MKNTPLVSIIIPAYNAEQFIEDTITSVKNQTHQNIEIIVVNDGSTDNTQKILENCPGINLINQSNGGVSSARNHGLSKANGDYICFLDADDWFYQNNIEQKVQFLEENKDYSLVHGLVEVTDENLNPTGRIMKGKSGNILNDILNFAPPPIPCPSNALMRKELLVENKFDTSLSTSADVDLWIRLSQLCKVGAIDEILMKYRTHSTSMFTNIPLQVSDQKKIYRKYHNKFDKRLWKKYKAKFFRSIAGHYYHNSSYLKAFYFGVIYLRYKLLP